MLCDARAFDASRKLPPPPTRIEVEPEVSTITYSSCGAADGATPGT